MRALGTSGWETEVARPPLDRQRTGAAACLTADSTGCQPLGRDTATSALSAGSKSGRMSTQSIPPVRVAHLDHRGESVCLIGNCFLGAGSLLAVGVGRKWCVRGSGGERGRKNGELGMSNDEWRPPWAGSRLSWALEDCWGGSHDGFSTLMSIAFLSAVIGFFLAASFRGADRRFFDSAEFNRYRGRGCGRHRAGPLWASRGSVAVGGVPTGVNAPGYSLIVIGWDPLFDRPSEGSHKLRPPQRIH